MWVMAANTRNYTSWVSVLGIWVIVSLPPFSQSFSEV